MRTHRSTEAGFTYLGLLAVVVIMGIFLTAAARVWSFTEQRERETQLLYVGDQYRMAISRYFAAGHHYPASLQDLLLDARTPVPRRYLRQLYLDPMTGDADWELIPDPTKVGIMGVASKSKLVPIKRAGFSDIDVGFAASECYCAWRFIYNPPSMTHRYSAPGH
jgi:type II secretory pathway pseudopilin PulG